MKWRGDKYWMDTLAAALNLSVNHSLILTPDEFVSSRDVFYPASQARRLDILTIQKVSAFVVQKDLAHMETLPSRILRNEFDRQFHCVFANEVFVIYSRLDENMELSDDMKQHVPSFMELRERYLDASGEEKDRKSETLPFTLDIQRNRVLQTLFPNHHYVLEMFQDLSGEPSILKRDVFKYCVKDVLLELSAFCNRSCSYCPVRLLNRKDKTAKMPVKIFHKCIEDLAEIDFEGTVLFNLFNEPLYDREYLMNALDYVDRMLPKCSIKLVSNGDYLTEEYFRELTRHRIDELTVSVHYDGIWEREKQWLGILEIINRIGLTEHGSLEEDEGRMIYYISPAAYDSSCLKLLELRTEDFTIHGVDRAGTLQSGVHRIRNFDHCSYAMSQMNIAYDGTVVPCCSMCADIPEIKGWTYGNVQDYKDIFSAYTCGKAAAFRRMLFAPRKEGEYTPDVCRTCSVAEFDGESKLYRIDDTVRREIYDCWLSKI